MNNITLTSEQFNKLQAALDEPMTVEDAEEILEEFGYTDATVPNFEAPTWYDPTSAPYRVYLQPPDMQNVKVCQNEQEVIALAEYALASEVA